MREREREREVYFKKWCVLVNKNKISLFTILCSEDFACRVWQSSVIFLFCSELPHIFLYALLECCTYQRLCWGETSILLVHFSHRISQIWDRARFFSHIGIWVQKYLKHCYNLDSCLVKLFLRHSFALFQGFAHFQLSENYAKLGMTVLR